METNLSSGHFIYPLAGMDILIFTVRIVGNYFFMGNEELAVKEIPTMLRQKAFKLITRTCSEKFAILRVSFL